MGRVPPAGDSGREPLKFQEVARALKVQSNKKMKEELSWGGNCAAIEQEHNAEKQDQRGSE